jgi:very-short-patch-repair endonuclease
MTQSLPLELIQAFSPLELEFAQLWEERHPGLDLVAQYPVRCYRIDFCHPQAKVAIECQGGTWVAGMGHSSGAGIERDCKKFFALAELGYLVFPLTCKMIEPERIDAIARTIKARKF